MAHMVILSSSLISPLQQLNSQLIWILDPLYEWKIYEKWTPDNKSF